MKVGYIGLGALGSELARRFLPTHEVRVWDIRRSAAEVFEQLGASVAATPAQLGQASDVVLLCLPRSSDVRQVIFGPEGLAQGLAPGKLVIDQTSGVPRETAEIAQQLAARGVSMMDAAVSASPHVVPQGGATLMASASDDVFERALPILKTITGTVYRCGTRVGDGQAMKMVNNAMNAGCRLGTLELVALGRKAGLSLDFMTEVLNKGAARNQTTEKMLPAIAQGKSSTNFALSLMLKDVNQAVSLGMDVGVPMPITNVVRGLLQIGANTLGDKALLEDMIGLIESMASTRLRQSQDMTSGRASVTVSVDAPGGSENERIVRLIENALASLCLMTTLECVTAGFKYGLSLEDMSTVLRKSSGWSVASQKLLPSLLSGQRMSPVELQGAVEDLKLAGALGVTHGAPMMISNAVRSLFEVGVNEIAGAPNCEAMAQSLYEAMSSIKLQATQSG